MNRKTIKSDKTKKKLCDTFIKIYSKKNIENITIGEITEKAGFNRGTFYRYYEDIYDMLDKIRNSLLEEIKTDFCTVLKNEPNLDFKDIPPIIIKFYTKNEKYIQPLIQKDSQFVSSARQKVLPLLMKALNLESSDSNNYSSYLIDYHLSGAFAVLNSWVTSGKEIKVEEIFDLISSVVTKGVINTMKGIQHKSK